MSSSTQANIFDLEIRLRAAGSGTYSADMGFTDPASAVASEFALNVPVRLDFAELQAAALNPTLYGALLSTMLFSEQRMRDGWARALGYVEGAGAALRLRMRLDSDDNQLHAVRWEVLQHPQSGQFLATDERVLFSRYLASAEAAPVFRRAPGALRALVLIASPSDLERYRLAAVDVLAEAGRARLALSELQHEIVAGGLGGRRASLAALIGAAREGYDIVYIVAHGRLCDGEPVLYLEDDTGATAPVSGAVITGALSQLARRPILVVLASCETAGDDGDQALTALGPRLVQAGLPAVLAMQGKVSMLAVARLMPTFLHELQHDGLIDRALATARAAGRDLNDWWRPVLYSRLRDGRIWEEPAPAPASKPAISEAGRAITNPFGKVGRLLDDAEIFGREELLRQIFEELAKGVSISLVGERQVGKSSLLTQICRLGPERLHLPPESFVYLNMQIMHDEDDFFDALCDAMNLPSPPDRPLRGGRLERALRGKQFIVCLDEVEKMTNVAAFSGNERDQLRGLADGGRPFRLVVASSSPIDRLFPDAEGKASPLANICHRLDVPPFTPRVARAFVRSRLEGSGVEFTEAQIDELIQKSAGNPARLQRAAADLFARTVQGSAAS